MFEAQAPYDAGPSLVDPWEPTGEQRAATADLLAAANALRTCAEILQAASLGSGSAFRRLQALRDELPEQVRLALVRSIDAAAFTALPL